MSEDPKPAVLNALEAEAWRMFKTGAISEDGHAAAEGAAAALSVLLPSEASDEEGHEAMKEALTRLARKYPRMAAGAFASLMKKGAQCRAEDAFAGVVQRFAERAQP